MRIQVRRPFWPTNVNAYATVARNRTIAPGQFVMGTAAMATDART